MPHIFGGRCKNSYLGCLPVQLLSLPCLVFVLLLPCPFAVWVPTGGLITAFVATTHPCLLLLLMGCVHVGVALDETFCNLRVALVAGPVQGCLTILEVR